MQVLFVCYHGWGPVVTGVARSRCVLPEQWDGRLFTMTVTLDLVAPLISLVCFARRTCQAHLGHAGSGDAAREPSSLVKRHGPSAPPQWNKGNQLRGTNPNAHRPQARPRSSQAKPMVVAMGTRQAAWGDCTRCRQVMRRAQVADHSPDEERRSG